MSLHTFACHCDHGHKIVVFCGEGQSVSLASGNLRESLSLRGMLMGRSLRGVLMGRSLRGVLRGMSLKRERMREILISLESTEGEREASFS